MKTKDNEEGAIILLEGLLALLKMMKKMRVLLKKTKGGTSRDICEGIIRE